MRPLAALLVLLSLATPSDAWMRRLVGNGFFGGMIADPSGAIFVAYLGRGGDPVVVRLSGKRGRPSWRRSFRSRGVDAGD